MCGVLCIQNCGPIQLTPEDVRWLTMLASRLVETDCSGENLMCAVNRGARRSLQE